MNIIFEEQELFPSALLSHSFMITPILQHVIAIDLLWNCGFVKPMPNPNVFPFAKFFFFGRVSMLPLGEHLSLKIYNDTSKTK